VAAPASLSCHVSFWCNWN